MTLDHDADADRVSQALRQSDFDQQVGQALPQRGAGERAGQHADQRDPDLDRRQEFAGIRRQRQRAAGTRDVLFDQRREPCRP